MTDDNKPKVKPRPKNKLLAVILLIIAILYGVLPIDLIPDVLFPLGLGDDALVILGALSYFYKAYFRKGEEGEERREKKDG